jgi:tRNA (guanine37-N1)-methyltransferase
MRFTFVTLFPNIIEGYFSDSILKRALEASYLKVDYLNPRDFSEDKHSKVDTPLVGGGAGMAMAKQPLFSALSSLKYQSNNIKFIFTDPAGKPFTQADAKRLAHQNDHIAFVSGRYEGIDERVIETFADEVFTIGDYILTGGELPSLVMCDAIARNIEGVLGNKESLDDESYETLLLEAPTFAKPGNYNGLIVPSELLKGNHSKITDLKNALAFYKTKYFRPKRAINAEISGKYRN